MITLEPDNRQISPRWREWLKFGLDVIFPPVCAWCGRVGFVLCPRCRGQLVKTPEPVCARCGRHQGLEHGAFCHECDKTPLPLVQMRAPLLYVEPVSRLIHRLKYEGYFSLAGPLSSFMVDGWPAWEQPPDLIMPIPLHPRRQRRRGYNQSERLARPLAQALAIQFDCAALRRTRHTIPQVGLGPAERADNVRGAFSADAQAVKGRHVLLVDDVLTTGATMGAAAEALLTAGAQTVSAYCLARVS